MTSNLRKLTRHDASQAEKWRLPSMDPTTAGVFRNENEEAPSSTADKDSTSIPTAAEIEQWHERAREEGYQQGYQLGLQQAQKEIAHKAGQLQELIEFFENPLRTLNEEIEQQLNQLVVSLAQQLVRREIKAEPGEIIGLIRESVPLLPASERNIRIVLHPEDAELVRRALQLDENEQEQSWKLVEDPMITRGGCEIKASKSVINATLENRLQALATSILGGERLEDQADDETD